VAIEQGADELLSLWTRVEAGELTPVQARDEAVGIGARVGEGFCEYLFAGTQLTEALAQDGEWRRGLTLGTLVRASASGITPRTPVADECLFFATAAYIEAAKAVLQDHPDPGLYTAARAVGETDAGRAAANGQPKLQGLLLFRLGAMLLDPYTVGREAGANYEHQHSLWEERARQQDDPALRSLLSAHLSLDESGALVRRPPSESMPVPLDALTMAEDYLRRAVPLVSDERRGRTLKALVQALVFKRFLGGTVDIAEVRSVASDALDALAADEIQPRLAVRALLRVLGISLDEGKPVSEFPDELDTSQIFAWDAIGQAAALELGRDPAKGLEILARRKQLTGPWDNPRLREAHYKMELSFLLKRDAPDWVTANAVRDRSISRVSARALKEATAPPRGSTARSRAAACLAVIAMAAEFDEEHIAIAQQERHRLSTIDPTFVQEHQQTIVWAIANLHEGEAVNHVRTGNHRHALHEYTVAAGLFLASGLPTRALHCCRGVEDMLKRGGITDLSELTERLKDWAGLLELLMPEAAREILRPVYGRAIWVALERKDPDVVLTLLQLAKGFVSSAWMIQGTSGFTLSEDEKEQLAKARELERELPDTESPLRPADGYGPFTEDLMLVALAGMAEETPATTVRDRLANLERQFEKQLVRHLAETLQAAPTTVTFEEIRRALDDRTVLLQLYYGPSLGDDVMALSVIMTAGSANFGFDTADTGWWTRTYSSEGHSLTVGPWGPWVADLREGLAIDPRPRLVIPPVREALAELPELFWRPLTGHLAELRKQGKDQLIIVPFAETHVCPLHLAGTGEGVLADDWTVSYALGISDVVRPAPTRPPGTRLRKAGAAFGMTYEGNLRISEIRSSRAEVSAVAALMRTEPVMDAAATSSAVKRALEECRWVHIRAHGRHNVAAPFLQTLFLSPADGSDGRLRAHEIFELDLRGLEVVTLGACETSLTRVDYTDNSRGLTPALLAAGANAVVGGLWDVRADASTEFYTAFYQALINDGAGVREAYARAQQNIRQTFPAYRDWGAFVLTGGTT
jgi:hypothetical protein